SFSVMLNRSSKIFLTRRAIVWSVTVAIGALAAPVVQGLHAQSPSNVAMGKPVTASVPSGSAALSIATDNVTDPNPFISLAPGLQFIEVDLHASYDISRLHFFHYWGDGRTYHDVVAQLSSDHASFATVFS